MSTWKVLIIDDEAQPSEDAKSRYQRFRKLENEQYDGKKFQLVFATDVDESRTKLKQDRFDVILLDVRLVCWGDDQQGTLFKELFELADRRFTVGLVSSKWDTTSMQLVRDFLGSNTQVQVPLFFTFRDFESTAFAAIATQIVTHIRRQRSLYTLELPPDEPLRLLHISDLHFGSTDAVHTLASLANTSLLCDKIKSEWPKRDSMPAGPHIVVVTGDIGNTGHPDDYVQALVWFHNFANEFGWKLPTPRILLVPGNHDFSVPLCSAQCVGINANKSITHLELTILSKSLCAYAMQPFSEFAAKVSATRDAWGQAPLCSWTEFGFAEYGVAFSGFNTSKAADDKSWPLRCIDEADITKVNDAFKKMGVSSEGHNLFHVSLSHHSLVKYDPVREEISNSNECSTHFIRSSSFPPKLLLHGHVHQRWGALPNGNSQMVVAAPTPTMNPGHRAEDSPRGVNLLTLNRTGTVVRDINAKSLIHLEAGWCVNDLPNEKYFKCD